MYAYELIVWFRTELELFGLECIHEHNVYDWMMTAIFRQIKRIFYRRFIFEQTIYQCNVFMCTYSLYYRHCAHCATGDSEFHIAEIWWHGICISWFCSRANNWEIFWMESNSILSTESNQINLKNIQWNFPHLYSFVF